MTAAAQGAAAIIMESGGGFAIEVTITTMDAGGGRGLIAVATGTGRFAPAIVGGSAVVEVTITTMDAGGGGLIAVAATTRFAPAMMGGSAVVEVTITTMDAGGGAGLIAVAAGTGRFAPAMMGGSAVVTRTNLWTLKLSKLPIAWVGGRGDESPQHEKQDVVYGVFCSGA